MNALGRRWWLNTAILIGVLYAVIGIILGLPTNNVRLWRLAAWVVSAIVFAFHIRYEHLRLRSSPVTTALHAALAVAIGAFGLAVAANVHEVLISPSYRGSLAVALIAWPVITAMPAFVVALFAAYGLSIIRRQS